MNGRINTVLLAIGVTLLTLNILGVKMPDAEAQVGGVADGPKECVPVGIAAFNRLNGNQGGSYEDVIFRLWSDGHVDRSVVHRSRANVDTTQTVIDG